MRSRPEAIIPSLDLRGTQAKLQALAVAGFLVLAVLLGGSSASGYTANAILQVAAIVAIAATIGWARGPGRIAAERHLLILLMLFAALFALQLLPLPPAIWTALPGRQTVVDGLTALGGPLPWMPVSLAPAKTLQMGLSLLVPAAAIVMIGAFQRPVARAGALALVAVTLLSVLVGVAQVAGSGGLYLYSYSNFGSAVGFFANSNHFGTLMCVIMPLAAGVVARWRNGADGEQVASRAFAAAALLGIVLLSLLGVIMTKSVAAVALAVLSVSGCAAIVLSGLPRRLRVGFLGGVVLVIVVAAGVALANGAGDLVAIGEAAGPGLSRSTMWHTTRSAIAQFGSVGAGFGTFPQVFHLFENPDAVDAIIANHAHNDLLEFVLEGGIPGVVLLVAFLTWFGIRFASVWLIERRRDPLAQGASVSALVVLLHSLVDYPLRTAAIAAIFGFCLAVLARNASGGSSAEAPAESQPARHLSA